MAESTDDVRRDIELTRERMAGTLQEIERKIDIQAIVRAAPLPALAACLGIGLFLGRRRPGAGEMTGVMGRVSHQVSGSIERAVSEIGTQLASSVEQIVDRTTVEVQQVVGQMAEQATSTLTARIAGVVPSGSGTRRDEATSTSQNRPWVGTDIDAPGVGTVGASSGIQPSIRAD